MTKKNSKLKIESTHRQLANLDTTVLSIPLLEDLEEGNESEVHRVIVEINLLNAKSRDKTKKDVTSMIIEVSDEDAINELLGSDTDQYIFDSLTAKQIQELATLNETLRCEPDGEGKDYTTRRNRPIYKIWPDFEVEMLLTESVSTVKADAARAAFAAAGRGIAWAVIDSGIDGTHPHFEANRNLDLQEPLTHWDFSGDKPKEIKLAKNVIDENGHGTHVAKIITGERVDKESLIKARIYCRDQSGEINSEKISFNEIRGIAPECKVVSLRVADAKGNVRASSIIAALGYVRRINGDGRLPRIHGVNLSLGHPFDPKWFACGQSPLCVEVDRLVRSGTVVVVAAGIAGFGQLKTKYKGTIDAGLSATLRDPANAHLAITVGSTHRDMPHVYGVSYFSAKGPTGDGRLKPDLVAPGEKIISCDSSWKDDSSEGCEYVENSGTSMAAPHVSGCIAALLSIRREFKNQPERVKEIFLETATDLGREKYYQGNGLVDLMRAIQSV